MTATIYARVSVEAKEWLDRESQKTGIPIAKIVDAILLDAARRGVTIEVVAPFIVRGCGEAERDG